MQINERHFTENFSFSVGIKVTSKASKQTLKQIIYKYLFSLLNKKAIG